MIIRPVLAVMTFRGFCRTLVPTVMTFRGFCMTLVHTIMTFRCIWWPLMTTIMTFRVFCRTLIATIMTFRWIFSMLDEMFPVTIGWPGIPHRAIIGHVVEPFFWIIEYWLVIVWINASPVITSGSMLIWMLFWSIIVLSGTVIHRFISRTLSMPIIMVALASAIVGIAWLPEGTTCIITWSNRFWIFIDRWNK